ncbi:hypothetical protein BACI349Y_450094 [Bacillus sp. 349Y]|nr:hypothetical protein BACI349Y_450094 [Bacillus sp. 349Y]
MIALLIPGYFILNGYPFDPVILYAIRMRRYQSESNGVRLLQEHISTNDNAYTYSFDQYLTTSRFTLDIIRQHVTIVGVVIQTRKTVINLHSTNIHIQYPRIN